MTGRNLPRDFYARGSGHSAAVRILAIVVAVGVLFCVAAIAMHV